jgi:thiosulfate reductase cytochrome b subunit
VAVRSLAEAVMTSRATAYPRWLRAWHWVNAIVFVALLSSGLAMHYSQPGEPEHGFRTSLLVHNTAGVLLTAGYLIFLAGNLFWGNGRFYLLAAGDLTWGLLRQARHYLLGIFVGERQPFPHTGTRKFNPLQKLSYLAVMYGLLPLLIVTGWALLFPEHLPARILGVPGIGIWAVAHTIVGFLLSLFMLLHTYLGTTGATTTELFRLMLTGEPAADSDARVASRPAGVRP